MQASTVKRLLGRWIGLEQPMVHKSDYSNEAAAPAQVSHLDVLEQLQFSSCKDYGAVSANQ